MKKHTAFLLCFIITLSLFSCSRTKNITESTDNQINVVQNSTNSSEYLDTYKQVLEVYRAAVDELRVLYSIVNTNPQGSAQQLYGLEPSVEKEWFLSIIDSFFEFYGGRYEKDLTSPRHKLSCGYALKDLNGDGTDELVLLNNDYEVGAIFSITDGKPVLLANYWPRNNARIDEKGFIHNSGSNGAEHSTIAVYKIADGGASLESIVEFGTNGTEWVEETAYAIYYKLVNGEKVSISEDEYIDLCEQYGEYSGSVGVAEATKEHSGLVFIPLYTEEEIANETYGAVINDEICVFDERLGEIKLKACRFPSNNLSLVESVIEGKSVLDFDGDGICEYIIYSSLMDSLVLHYYNGNVYSYSFDFRSIYNVNTDGSFYWNDSNAYGSSKITFDGNLLKVVEIYKVVNDGEPNAEYYIYGDPVSKEEVLKYTIDNPANPISVFNFEAPWQKAFPLEKALQIASEYWNIQNGDVDKETGYCFAIIPEISNDTNHTVSLSLFDEEAGFSTIEKIKIDASTGEIMSPASNRESNGISSEKAIEIAKNYWGNLHGNNAAYEFEVVDKCDPDYSDSTYFVFVKDALLRTVAEIWIDKFTSEVVPTVAVG